jgi:nitrogen fixation protein FixH
MNVTKRLLASDRWIPLTFVAFFVVVIAVNATMAALALGTWTGLTTNSSYRDGLAYNERLEKARTQAALGWQVALETRDAKDGSTELVVRLRDRFDRAMSDAEVTASFVRPTQSGDDFNLTLAPMGDGLYGAHVKLPLSGQWDLQLHVSRDGQHHESVRRLYRS